ncbi:hypothetical protein [Sinomicrobium weinanense]|uniref:Carboxypeptidase regulatory-like domain-containing protein n=1 Tax=Sinomicrobium weinanense TaxID=2842200 RepID=A0A926Q3V9_9FLAO|nr:hypothetical protein [Sinomicrobium weinanense]MBC9797334.1 hypothetical protein [Sinomicrobium weinanense]MBU3124514.1 hypothetical protein [Sinomicrobium weinanense]
MKYAISGRLYAAICDDEKHIIANTKVRVYRIEQDINMATALTAARSKEVSRGYEENEIKARKSMLLAETETDGSGHYEFEIDGDRHKYNGGAIEVVLHYDKVPGYGQQSTTDPRGFKPFQVLLDVIQPKWRETNTGAAAVWNYTLLRRIWCYILQRLDIWVICGTLLNCESQQPLEGIEVIAMDDDIITDDRLGSDITDSNGKFCIYYRSADFKKTFLSPWINVETTPVFSFDNGPDIYFKFAAGGMEFHAEPTSEAHKPSRKNVGNCLCVRLCLDDAPQGTLDPPAAFYQIGHNRKYHPVLNIDPATGRTTGKAVLSWNEQAFFSTVELRGSLSEELNSNPVEYKFQYAEVPSPGTDISSITTWTDVTPADIAPTVIASRVTQYFPIIEVDYYAIKATGAQVDVPFNGNWIQVPQYNGPGFGIAFDGSLIKLITQNLAGSQVNKSGLIAGNSSAPLEKNRYFVLRMRKREAGNPATEVAAGFSRPLAIFNTVYQNVPQGGSWLPAASSSELGIATVDLQELADGGGCSKLTNTLRVNYTAANPNLGQVSISMSGPGGPHNFEPVVFTTPGEEARGQANYTGTDNTVDPSDVASLPSCSYEVRLTAELNLTNGEQQHHNIWDRVLFCK